MSDTAAHEIGEPGPRPGQGWLARLFGHRVLAPLAPKQRRDHAEQAVLRVVRELTGASASALGAETALMDAGVDSLATAELARIHITVHFADGKALGHHPLR